MNEDDINSFLKDLQEETGIILDKYCHRDNVFVSKGEMAERIKERISVIEEEIRRGTQANFFIAFVCFETSLF